MPKRILLCDDEPHILRAAEIKFQRAGFEVRCASDGVEAWDRIQEQLPDIVITDCQMPRLSGIELAARIHDTASTARIPVIMLTGKEFELSQAQLRESYNVLAVLGKPFSPRDLLRRVEAILGVSTTPTSTPTSTPTPTPTPIPTLTATPANSDSIQASVTSSTLAATPVSRP